MNTTQAKRIRTASELKAHVEAHGKEPYFFTRSSMKFFGDTMRNYSVSGPEMVQTRNGPEECYALNRRYAVKHGLISTAFFSTTDFRRVFPVA